MRKAVSLAALVMAYLAPAAYAEDKTMLFDIESALHTPAVAALLDPAIRVVWDEKDLPEYADRSNPDDFTRSSKFSGFPNSPSVAPPSDKCLQAFGETVAAMQAQAQAQKYDVVLIHGDDAALKQKNQFSCVLGYVTNDVRLMGEFVASKELVAKLAANPPELVRPAPRKPSENVRNFTIAAALATPQGRGLLSMQRGTKLHWGFGDTPAYVKRAGPQEFHREQDANLGAEIDCGTAFLATLNDMITTARNKGYNAVVRIHSSLNDQLAPDDSTFECRVAHGKTNVSLNGTLVVLK
jgi:hypothetical protein